MNKIFTLLVGLALAGASTLAQALYLISGETYNIDNGLTMYSDGYHLAQCPYPENFSGVLLYSGEELNNAGGTLNNNSGST